LRARPKKLKLVGSVTPWETLAEQQRKLQIDALTKDVSLLRDVTRSFESSVDAINGVASIQVAISSAGSREIGARAASYAMVEKVRAASLWSDA
jgi:hypothetical protein